jgi:ribosomal protein L11 methyltransferase
MQWMEVSVDGLDGEGAEAAFEILNRWGYGGAVIEEIVRNSQNDRLLDPSANVRAYLPMDGTQESARQRIEQALWHLSQLHPLPEPTVRVLNPQEWANVWKKHYPVRRVGHRLVLVPSWQAYRPTAEDIVITLDPGQAFGTGLHPSTRLCLMALERLIPGPRRVLDVGTGSGILAIAAAKLGARVVIALDVDPVAAEAARENVLRNRVEPRVHAVQGTVDSIADAPQWNLIVVNILADVIPELMPALTTRLAADGRLVLAGIVEDREPVVLDALTRHGLHVVRRENLLDWVLLLAQRSRPPGQRSG